ncbi:MAG: ATP-binding protein [Acidobacteria bacterium]|nr:ATP-binding protein [Acidobacteriota bacterium]
MLRVVLGQRGRTQRPCARALPDTLELSGVLGQGAGRRRAVDSASRRRDPRGRRPEPPEPVPRRQPVHGRDSRQPVRPVLAVRLQRVVLLRPPDVPLGPLKRPPSLTLSRMQTSTAHGQPPAADDCIDEMRMELSPRLSAISGLVETIEAFGKEHNIPDAQIYFVNLEIDELMTNYVAYAFRKVARPRMNVVLRTFANRLVLVVEDSGPPFNPLEAPEADLTSGINERRLGGMGLHLVREYADRIDYRCVDERNILTLEHKFGDPKGE